MLAPQRIWWKPLDRYEKSWLTVAFVWCLVLTAMMPIWFYMGHQNVPTETYRVTAEQYTQLVMDSITQHQVGDQNGIPIVEAPPGSDIYLWARQWQWFPILQMKKGETYRLHISSTDIQHGFSLQPTNLNLQILPGYDYVATVTPTQSGEFSVICNEFCSIGHHLMTGKIIVTE